MKGSALALIALPLALLLQLAGCASRYAHPLPAQAREHRVKTADGWELALVQYLPEGVPSGRPVLLCHGISANGRHMDLDERHSLARWLASQGREAWTLSLRGTGDSDRVDAAAGREGGYTFDTLWQSDLPAAIDYVRSRSATPGLIAQAKGEGLKLAPHLSALQGEAVPRIDYVGHSMGGMLIYAYLSQGGQGINAVGILASPTRLDWGGALEPYVVSGARFALDPEEVLPMATAALLTVPLQGYVSGTPLERLLYNPQNVSTETWQRALAIGTGDVSSALWLQMSRMIETGAFSSADGAIDFRRDLAKVQRPAIVFAGKIDRIASPPAVKDGFRAWGGPKQWVLAAEENGMAVDYGHMGFVIGERAATEIWPLLLNFLDRHPE